MRKNLRKSIKIYFKEKIKKQAMPLASNAAATATTTISAATSLLMSTCRHPRTPSLSLNIDGPPLTSFKGSTLHGETPTSLENPNNGQHAATLSDVERFLVENFNSLFVREDRQAKAMDRQTKMEPSHPPSSPPLDDVPPSKHYFLFSETGMGNLNGKVAPERTKFEEESPLEHVHKTINDESTIAMRTLSADPYGDFRRSMEEVMAVQRGRSLCAPVDWDFMEELLLCYLDINDRSVHRYILEAFSDLAVSARRRRPTTTGGGRRKVREMVDM